MNEWTGRSAARIPSDTLTRLSTRPLYPLHSPVWLPDMHRGTRPLLHVVADKRKGMGVAIPSPVATGRPQPKPPQGEDSPHDALVWAIRLSKKATTQCH
jgi:hypothetical protein